MKNKVILTSLIAIALLCFSCSTEELNTEIQKTNVAFLVASPANTTSKQVQRGDISVWVNRVDITAVSGSYSKSDQLF